MKKLLIATLGLTILACKEEAPKDYATLSGKILNKTSDSIFVQNRIYSKAIALNEDGTFSDTLKVEPGIYYFSDENEMTTLFLKNGYDLNVNLDTKMFDESIKYTGEGSEHSNFLAEKNLLEEKLLDFDKLSIIDNMEELNQSLQTIKTELNTFYNSKPEIDSLLLAEANQSLEPLLNSYRNYIGQSIALKEEMPKGMASPVFENYKNYAGGTSSLSDFKGKYVYIDIWATWCGPCKVEIPYLKELDEKYKDKNIQFVSVSVDDGRGYRADSQEAAQAASFEGWKAMIQELEMGGVQLFADHGFESEFIQAYKINGIPRFILLDPNGNISDLYTNIPSFSM